MPEKDKNSQEGPDVRGNLIKVNVGGDTIFVDSNQYFGEIELSPALFKCMFKVPSVKKCVLCPCQNQPGVI